MFKPDFRYLVLWVFLFGIIVIVFLQVMSGYNITRFVQGNKSLLNELKIQNDLRRLASDVVVMESDVRGVVITSDTTHLADTKTSFAVLELGIQNVNRTLNKDMPEEMRQLEKLVRDKMAWNQKILTAYNYNGKKMRRRNLSLPTAEKFYVTAS